MTKKKRVSQRMWFNTPLSIQKSKIYSRSMV